MVIILALLLLLTSSAQARDLDRRCNAQLTAYSYLALFWDIGRECEYYTLGDVQTYLCMKPGTRKVYRYEVRLDLGEEGPKHAVEIRPAYKLGTALTSGGNWTRWASFGCFCFADVEASFCTGL